MRQVSHLVIWIILATAAVVPMAVSALSPLHAWRHPIYIASSMAGVAALTILLFQPLLAGRYLPGVSGRSALIMHRRAGLALVALVLIHVAGLLITNTADAIDALLFVSPTPFSPWGVAAMWAIFAAATMVALRRRLPVSPKTWRIIHVAFAGMIVVGGVVHAMLIEGTMGLLSKTALCIFVLASTMKVLLKRRDWRRPTI